jgi:hypothetical protein
VSHLPPTHRLHRTGADPLRLRSRPPPARRHPPAPRDGLAQPRTRPRQMQPVTRRIETHCDTTGMGTTIMVETTPTNTANRSEYRWATTTLANMFAGNGHRRPPVAALTCTDADPKSGNTYRRPKTPLDQRKGRGVEISVPPSPAAARQLPLFADKYGGPKSLICWQSATGTRQRRPANVVQLGWVPTWL